MMVGLGCGDGGRDSDLGCLSWLGRRLALGDSHVDDLGGDVVDIILFLDSPVDGRCHSQDGAEGTKNDGGTHLDIGNGLATWVLRDRKETFFEKVLGAAVRRRNGSCG
jgi:hypothetical protein